ncbi:MAG TPA: acetyl-CoA carboxylase biotin carboxyl carrier protein [Roseiarcus sp.]
MRKLAAILDEMQISEIELEQDGIRVRVARTMIVSATAPQSLESVSLQPVASVLPGPSSDSHSHPGAVKSPMVGTAYLRPSPESKAFVEVGSLVKSGEKIMLVEAMKTYNEIVAPRAGKITHIFVEDGSPVEYGQALMVIE